MDKRWEEFQNDKLCNNERALDNHFDVCVHSLRLCQIYSSQEFTTILYTRYLALLALSLSSLMDAIYILFLSSEQGDYMRGRKITKNQTLCIRQCYTILLAAFYGFRPNTTNYVQVR